MPLASSRGATPAQRPHHLLRQIRDIRTIASAVSRSWIIDQGVFTFHGPECRDCKISMRGRLEGFTRMVRNRKHDSWLACRFLGCYRGQLVLLQRGTKSTQGSHIHTSARTEFMELIAKLCHTADELGRARISEARASSAPTAPSENCVPPARRSRRPALAHFCRGAQSVYREREPEKA